MYFSFFFFLSTIDSTNVSRFRAPKRLKSPQLRVDYRVKERKNRGLRSPRFTTVHQ